MSKTAAILGAGWVGTALAESLIEQGFTIHLSRRVLRNDLKKAKHFCIDLTQRSNFEDFLNVEILFICIPSKKKAEFENLIKSINRSPIKRVIYLSSTGVYRNPKHPFWEIENLLSNDIKVPVITLRLGGLVGYNREPGNFFQPQKPIPRPNHPVNLIHRDDVIGILLKILNFNFNENYTLDAVADLHPNRLEYYQKRQQLVGNAISPGAEPSDREVISISNQRIKQLLDYEFIFGDLNFPFQN